MFFKKSNSILEEKAKEKLSTISVEEVNRLAKKYKNSIISSLSIFGGAYLLLAIAILIAIPILLKTGENVPLGAVIFLIVLFFLSVFAGVLFFVYVNHISKMEVKELAIRAIISDFAKSGRAKTFLEQANITDKSFIISKSISILASGWSSTKLLIDNQNKKFIYQKGKVYSKSYKFSDIINYEVYENGKSQVQGRAGSALIGGAFFGLGGLIVGSSMSRNINEKCNQLKLIIRLNDFDCPQIVITYIDNVDWDKSGWTYRNMKENIQAVCSILEYMLNEKTLEQSFAVKQEENTIEKKSTKEQMQELKEMLDDGLITQDDFEQKKNQILGL